MGVTHDMTQPRKKPSAPRRHVKIYPSVERGKPRWTLSWFVDGARHRRSFSDETAAELEADAVEELVARGRGLRTTLDPNDTHSLSLFRADFPSGQFPLGTVLDFWKQNHGHSSAPQTILVSDACSKFTLAKAARSVRHRETVRNHLARFTSAFGTRQLGEVEAESIGTYLTSIVGGSPKTRKNHLITITALFRWAKAQKYLPFHLPTAPEAVEKPKTVGKEHAVFTPVELCRVLAAAPEDLLAWVVLGAFAGVRSAERLRLRWEDWKPEHGALVLGCHVTKTGRRRSVDAAPNLAVWLAPLRGEAKGSDLIVPTRYTYKQTPGVASAAGVPWKPNALRATYASSHLELHGNAPLTAKNTGHSVQELETSYLALLSKADAGAWFDITPASVLAFAAAEGLPVPRWAGRLAPAGG